MPSLIARFTGPDEHQWEWHHFGRDSYRYHAMVIPADASIEPARWWWGEEDPATVPVDTLRGYLGGLLALWSPEDAFIDSQGRAVWARRIGPDDQDTVAYVCEVIGIDDRIWRIVDVQRPVPITRALIKARWEAAS